MAITYNGTGGGVPRKTAHIFAKKAANNDVTVFGSTLDNDTQYTTDIADIQTFVPTGGTDSTFEVGWRDAVISDKNYPLLADMNGVMLTFSQQLAYLLQHGLAQWDSGTTYYTYDIVNVNGVLYISTDDNNINNNPTTFTKWAVFYDPSKLDDFANIDLSNLSAYGEARLGNLIKWVVNDGKIDSNENLDLIDAEESVNTTYSYAQSGTYTFTILNDAYYPITIIGAGGKGATWYVAVEGYSPKGAGGGSGAGFSGQVYLTAGTYTVKVGSNVAGKRISTLTQDSTGTVLISAGGGANGSAGPNGATGGAGGILDISNATIDTYTISSNGNVGGKNNSNYNAQGGASVYNNSTKGYGAGGGASGSYTVGYNYDGYDGYFEITIANLGSSEVNYKVSTTNPLTIVDSKGVKQTFIGVNNDQIGSLADGTYNKFIDNTGTDFFKNTIYYQVEEPSAPTTNDVWVKTVDPLEVYKYSGSVWEEYNRVYIGSVVVSSGAVATNGIKNTELYKNGFNVTTFDFDKKRYIVETYTNSTSWYRIWSDGWCEQGGLKTVSGNSGTTTIDLFKTMSDTNYTILSTDIQSTGVGGGGSAVISSNTTVSSFKISWTEKAMSGFYWQVCGYIA